MGDKSLVASFKLPIYWKLIESNEISPQKAILGYRYNANDSAYTVYLTDYRDVWIEQVDKYLLMQKAKEHGYMNTNPETLKDILQILNEKVTDKNMTSSDFTLETFDEDMIFTIHVDDLTWRFELSKLPAESALKIFVQLNMQQLSNTMYLDYFIDQMQQALSKKDVYIRFLETNLSRTHHGEELMQNFVKNNRGDKTYRERFDINLFSQLVSQVHEAENKVSENIASSTKGVSEDIAWPMIEKSMEVNVSRNIFKFSHNEINGNEDSAGGDGIQKDQVERNKIELVSPTKKKRRRIGIVETRKSPSERPQ